MPSGFPQMVDVSVASSLLDVVVFAGGNSLDLMPLTASEPKSMLRVCNRPLIWYCLAPWIDAGFRSFFICVNEDYATLRTYLTRAFSGVAFYFVLVPLTMNDHPSTTCDAVKAYLKLKESMRSGALHGSSDDDERLQQDQLQQRTKPPGSSRAHNASRDPLKAERAALSSLSRDAVLLSCDTVLAGVDLERFVASFYCSLASASVLLYRPYTAPPPPPEEGSKKKKGTAASLVQRGFQHTFSCVAYEDDDVLATMTAGSAAGAANDAHEDAECASSVPSEGGRMSLRRLHFMYRLEDEVEDGERIPAQKPEPRISMAFAARRPRMTFGADLVDVHAYLVRHWVMQFIAESAGKPDISVGKDILPMLARSQHSTVNTAAGIFVLPDAKICHPIPHHWLHKRHGDLTVQSLNAAPGIPLPPEADTLRVFGTILDEDPNALCRVYRIHNRTNYQAANHEVVRAKCQELHLEELGEATNASAANQLTTSARALAALLPDNPFTLRARMGSQQVFIVGSFVDSVPPPNVYITRSVIGPNVTIGAGARITDSILLGNVEIGSKAVITNSVIGTSAVVTAGRRVTDSIVAPRCYVEQDETDCIVE